MANRIVGRRREASDARRALGPQATVGCRRGQPIQLGGVTAVEEADPVDQGKAGVVLEPGPRLLGGQGHPDASGVLVGVAEDPIAAG